MNSLLSYYPGKLPLRTMKFGISSPSCLMTLALFCTLTVGLPGQMSVETDAELVVESQRRAESAMAMIGTKRERAGFDITPEGYPIFGSQLFQGDFKDLSFSGFNPDYQIAVGDTVQLMIWGALEEALELQVDAQGNVFVPRIGPLRIAGVRNADLNSYLNNHVRRTYRDNVDAYANLVSTQAVKVFVSGFVRKPGLYEGFASDSVLYYLDRANGIDPERGSYLNIRILRQNEPIATLSLYDFLEHGRLPITQFRDGDVILVGPRGNTAVIFGDVTNPGRFEFTGDSIPLGSLLKLASPGADATHANVRRTRAGRAEALTFPISETGEFQLRPRDQVQIVGRHVPDTILITISGEHEGPEFIVLPYGADVASALAEISPSPHSDLESLQLFRESVAERQRSLLVQSLDNLERIIMNARSQSLEEAQLRLAESEMLMNFIARAREIKPRGQVILESLAQARSIQLEDGDILFIPPRNQLVTVFGEVNFPNTQTYRQRDFLSDYIERAGGFTANANKTELIVIKRNGAIENVGSGRRVRLDPGDEIIILPRPDRKTLQFAKDVTTIMYQIAIAARVVIGL